MTEYEKDGWTKRLADGRWCFTPTGFLLSNLLIGSLLEAQAQQRLSVHPWMEEPAPDVMGQIVLPSDREIH